MEKTNPYIIRDLLKTDSHRIIGLLSKFFPMGTINTYIRQSKIGNMTDIELFKILHAKYSGRNVYYRNILPKKAEFLTDTMKGPLRVALEKDDENITYLDIGCEETVTVKKIGKAFSLEPSCINIQVQHSGITYGISERDKDPIFSYYNGSNIPRKDESISLITIFMVLHHIPPKIRSKLIKDIYRVLKPRGILVVKEHDIRNISDKYLADIEHYIYEMIIPKEQNIDFYKTYMGSYISRKKLIEELKNIGFKIGLTYYTPERKWNYTRKYFMSFTK